LDVLERIKRSGEGIGVKELAALLGMSYMGVKAHCLALVSAGYLTTWRVPSTRGRPLMLYRLTDSGELLFAESDDSLAMDLLREASGLFGNAAPQKLLVMHFRNLAESYREKLSGTESSARVDGFVKLRDREGRMTSFHAGVAWEIHECHNPLAGMMRKYPFVPGLEEHMVGDVLGLPVSRTEREGMVVFKLRT
jgi:predicted ArsR family transcriptional regulator